MEAPAVADEGGDVAKVGPKGSEEGSNGVLDGVEGVEKTVADVIFEFIGEFSTGLSSWEPGF